MTDWIDVKDRLPEPFETVDVKCEESICWARLDNEEYWSLVSYPKITHWRPIKR